MESCRNEAVPVFWVSFTLLLSEINKELFYFILKSQCVCCDLSTVSIILTPRPTCVSCHWNLQVKSWCTPESSKLASWSVHWKGKFTRHPLCCFLCEIYTVFPLRKHGEGGGTVENSSQQRREEITGKQTGPGSGLSCLFHALWSFKGGSGGREGVILIF